MAAVERVEGEPAYLLLRRPYRDSSLLLEALTPAHGRVGLVARGGRSPRRGQGRLALLQRYRLGWQRRGELATLTAFEAEGPAAAVAGEPVFWVWYANELLLRALPRDDAHPRLFAHYGALLGALSADANADASGEQALRRFEWELLRELGYQPSDAASPQPGQRYRYDAAVGVQADDSGPLEGAALADALAGRFDSAAARQAGRALFAAHLPQLCGPQPLKTPAMLRQLRGLRGAAP